MTSVQSLPCRVRCRQSSVMASLQSLPCYVHGIVRVNAVTTTDTAGGGGGAVGVTKYGRGPRRFRYLDPLVCQQR